MRGFYIAADLFCALEEAFRTTYRTRYSLLELFSRLVLHHSCQTSLLNFSYSYPSLFRNKPSQMNTSLRSYLVRCVFVQEALPRVKNVVSGIGFPIVAAVENSSCKCRWRCEKCKVNEVNGPLSCSATQVCLIPKPVCRSKSKRYIQVGKRYFPKRGPG